jgi:hypothetical protein
MDVDNPREVTQEEAQQLWNSDAESVFRSFRDHSITLIETVARVHYLCAVSDPTVLVAQLLEPMSEFFDACRYTAKNMWWSTPLQCYFTRPRPIIVFELGTRRTRLDGSCFHEVAINFADSLYGCVQDSVRAGEYTSLLRFQTGRGDEVTDYLKSLVADIRCEWREALERFWQSKYGTAADKTQTNGQIGVPPSHSSQDQATPSLAPAKPIPFTGGEMVFFPDRVELCGVDICSGPRAARLRKMLDLLRISQGKGFVTYSGAKLAERLGLSTGQTAAAGAVRDIRDRITKILRDQANIHCEEDDVIVSGGSGYRFANCITVQEGEAPDSKSIGDTERQNDVPDVPHPRVPNGPDVPDEATKTRRIWILEQLAQGQRLKAPDVSKQFGCSARTAKRDLAALKDEKTIEFVGAARTGYYRLRRPSEPADSHAESRTTLAATTVSAHGDKAASR